MLVVETITKIRRAHFVDGKSIKQICRELRNRGYDAIRRYAAGWSKVAQEVSASAYVPLSFDPGEAYQFDWSHEIVILDGVTVTLKVAHVRLCHSRMPFVTRIGIMNRFNALGTAEIEVVT